MDGSRSLLIRSDSSLALRCRKGAIHPITRSPRRRAQAALSSQRRRCADDVAFRALHDDKQFLMLRPRDIEFRHRVVEVFAKSVPLTLGDLKVFMGFAHRTSCVVLSTAHVCALLFAAPLADVVMSLDNGIVCIQDWVVQNPINEVVNYRSNRIDAAEALVERRLAAF